MLLWNTVAYGTLVRTNAEKFWVIQFSKSTKGVKNEVGPAGLYLTNDLTMFKDSTKEMVHALSEDGLAESPGGNAPVLQRYHSVSLY